MSRSEKNECRWKRTQIRHQTNLRWNSPRYFILVEIKAFYWYRTGKSYNANTKVMPRKRNTHQDSFPFDRLQLESYSSNDFASSADTLQFNGFFVCGWQQKRKSNNHEIRTEFLQKSNFAKDGTHYIRRIQFQKCYSRIAPS